MKDLSSYIANVRSALDELEAAQMGTSEEEAMPEEEMEDEEGGMDERMGMMPKKQASMKDYFAKKV